MKTIERWVSEAYALVNNSLSRSIEMIDYVYPNHDGVQDAEATGNLMYLRQSVASLKRACELLEKKLTEAIGDTLEQEIVKTGYRYRDNGDGTYDVCYDHAQDTFS